MSEADKTQWGPMPPEWRARLARRFAAMPSIRRRYAARVDEAAMSEQTFGSMTVMGLVWCHEFGPLWTGFERDDATRCLIWRAYVSRWHGPVWTVSTVKGEMATRFATAEDAMAAVDAAFDANRASPHPSEGAS